MVSSYVGENAEFERQYLSGELEVELTPQVSPACMKLCVCVCPSLLACASQCQGYSLKNFEKGG